MNNLKYVTFEDGSFLIFPASIKHCDVAVGHKKVRTAGFVCLSSTEDGEMVTVQCHGKSFTLQLESDPSEDSAVISLAINSRW